MSLYYSHASISHERLSSVAKELARPIDKTVLHAGAGGFLWVGRDPVRFGPAYDPVTGVRVVASGHLVFSAADWASAARLPYQGGLGTRLLLQRFLEKGAEAVTPYNGSTVVVIHDPRRQESHVWTDQFGYHPCFIYRSESPDKAIVTTFADVLLSDPGVSVEYDLVSMAEFIRAWRATPPNTYFAEVKYAGAATHLILSNRTTQRLYWRPFAEGFYPSIGDAAEDLAAAVKAAIQERTAVAERTLFFLSGGADSRVMLFSAADRAKVVGVNIYEHASAETEIARQLCLSAGCRFETIQRDNDYYPRNLPDIARWSGAMWSAEDTHYPGFEQQLASIDADLVMTACTTDWLFKGYGLEKEHVPLFGRRLPFLRYLNERGEGFLPNLPLRAPSALAQAVNARMDAWFAGTPTRLSSPHDRLAVEDRRIRPACYTVSVSGQAMYRIFPYDTFFADSRVAACYSRTHPDWKLNREVWGKAAARICKGAGRIVDANWGWRVDASPTEKAFVFATGWFSRRLKSRVAAVPLPADRPPPSGSWPDLGWYATNSKTLRQLWESVTAEERTRFETIAGTDHWSRPLEAWRSDGYQLFRLLTLLCHWRECDRRREVAALAPITAAAI